ncbi:DUF6701 domain-containing protein [Thalassolituus marinus]|uniref:DUF6701 domain-containing protein n=1 Tax=Thalassolituus marinus TaxID=671053 RepID=A0ABS7ZRB1_9GAMM|nr:DUF6701 domain-containing protein [Thalassolituus marinus]MCA6064264.1 hypothetical protein [Thalassolituus marinus]
MMTVIRRSLFILALLCSHQALAYDYVFSYWGSDVPPCTGGSWSVSGSTFTCTGSITLNPGDTMTVATSFWEFLGDIVVQANAGITLNGNTVGSAAKSISLVSAYGDIVANGSNTIYGDISSSSGSINLSNTTVNGSVDTNGSSTLNNSTINGDVSASNGVTTTDSSISGSVSADTGTISLTGGEVGGLVSSNCCTITTSNTDLYGGAQSLSSGIFISGGTIQGDFYSNNNYSEFDGVTMLSGTISGASSLNISNSTLGTASDPVTVSTVSGAITLTDTTAYGDFTAPTYSTVYAYGSTVIIGSCTPGSTPAESCQGSGGLTCLTDTFSNSSLGSDWVTSRFSGSFTPTVSSGRLLLTQDVTYQSTAATLQRWFPAENNLVEIEFDHYAWSPNYGDGADGITLVFSDATVTPQAGSFGGSLGYAQRDNGDTGFAGGWLGIALDEYGNFSNPTEGRQGGTGFVPNSVSVRGSGENQTGYRFITGTGQLNPNIDRRRTSTARPGYRYRITIDARTGSAAYLTVERSTNGSSFSTLIASTDVAAASGQATIPENLWLSLTGSTGGSSNNHAIDNLQICAKTINPVGPLVHHFEMEYSSNALTCNAQEVLIRACKNASCSELFTDDVSVTLSPSGWQGGDTLTIVGGSSTFNLWHTTAETVNLSVLNSYPVRQAYTTNTCAIDGGSQTSNCSLTFSDSGFVVDAPDIIAGQGSALASIQAVKKDDVTQACVPAFASVNRSLQLWTDYVNPDNTARVVSWPVSINGTDIGTDSGSATPLTLSFDTDGKATFTLNYADAGRMQLNALLTGSGNDAGLSMTGSNQFSSVPAGFCVQTSGECAAADETCPAFVAAGSDFTLSVQAMGWQMAADSDFCSGNTPTPSFAMSGMALSVDKVSPVGGVNGVVSPLTYNHTAAANNLNQITASESEVGVFNFRVSPGANYLGVALADGISQASGRFYPHHYSASVVSAGELAPYCSTGSAFAYTGQPLSWLSAPRLQITAFNQSGNTTQNYTESGYVRLAASAVSISGPVTDNSAVGTDSNALVMSSVVNDGSITVAAAGVLNYDMSSLDTATYSKSVLAQVAPLTPDVTYSLGIFSDPDGAALSSAMNITPAANFQLRYGRLWLENAYGPETMNLTLAARNEYFNGSRFVVNADDSCWTYDSASDVTLGVTGLTEVTGNTGTLSAGISDDAVLLTAPIIVAGSPDTGETSVSYRVPVWLQDDFNGDGSLQDPAATATFGVYRGHDRIIYWREIYQ